MGKQKKRIKPVKEEININRPELSHPVFCFKYLQRCSYDKCKDSKFFIDFLERLKKLGELGWKGIDGAAKHSFGYEKIPVSCIKPNVRPSIMTEDVEELTVFRANGNNLPFIGIRLNDTFHVIFIETKFNDIYNH